MKERNAWDWGLLVGAWMLCPDVVMAGIDELALIETKIVDVVPGEAFTSLADLDGPIRFGSATSLALSGLRSVWTVKTPEPVDLTGFTPGVAGSIRTGLTWDISDGREISVVLPMSSAPQFGKTVSGVDNVVTKVGSNSTFPGMVPGEHDVRAPKELLLFVVPGLVREEAGFYVNSSDAALIRSSDGNLSRLVGVGDPIPNHPGATFSEFGVKVAMGDGYAAFTGVGTGLSGAYSVSFADGLIRPLAESDFLVSNQGFMNDVALGAGFAVIAADNAPLRETPPASLGRSN